MTENEGVGPFLDKEEDFAHLTKIKVRLMVRPVDEDKEYRNTDEIEVSQDETLFEVLNRRVAFQEWYKLTGVVEGAKTQLYKWHGPNWFEQDYEACRQGAKEAVGRFQGSLHDLARGVFGVLLLEVREKEVEKPREAAASVSDMLAELKGYDYST